MIDPKLAELQGELRERLRGSVQLRWVYLAVFGDVLLVLVGVRWFWRRSRAHEIIVEFLSEHDIRQVGARMARVAVH